MLIPLYRSGEIAKRIEELANEISLAYKDREVTAIAVCNGALFFAADLIRLLTCHVFVDSIGVNSYVHAASSGSLSLRAKPKLPMEGRHILFIDDILDTGLTLHALTHLANRENAASVRTCVLINKMIFPSQKKLLRTGQRSVLPNSFSSGTAWITMNNSVHCATSASSKTRYEPEMLFP